MRRILFGLLIFVVLAVVVLAALGVFTARRSFPQTAGELNAPGLQGQVDIYRDEFGIPQIYASNSHDLFFAQGYVHAQDRFFQMDFWRHIGSARLSEMFGAAQLETDQFLRTLGFNRVAAQELANLDPTTRQILEDYAAGVNAYLATRQGSQIGLEYAVLGLINSGYEVEPWQPINTLTWAKVMAWDLSDQLGDELARARLLKTLSPEQVAELYPEYPEEQHPLIVPGEFAPQQQNVQGLVMPVQSDTAVADFSRMIKTPVQPATPRQGEVLDAVMARTAGRLAGLDALIGPRSAEIGSNNWVISGSLTDTGQPLLANDPHLGAQIPSIWYEIGLHCNILGADCPYNVTGFSFAGAPGVIIGHNDRIAWGVTNVGPDVQDLYLEKINPANPNQYAVEDGWEDFEVVTETIQVAGEEPVELSVRYTRHGPVVSDSYGDFETFADESGVPLPEPWAVTLRWTALEPGYLFRAIWKFNQAQNWDDFREAAQDFVVPAQNLIYADVDGNIGYQMPGNIPMRSSGLGNDLVEGWTGEGEWTGYIPFEDLPFAFNPPQGYIATANNAVVGSDYPNIITTQWDYGYRAARIVELLESTPGPIDAARIAAIQGDNYNANAATLVPLLQQYPLEETGLEKARTVFQNWDYQMDMESAPAALFEVFWNRLMALTFHDDLPETDWPQGSSRWFLIMEKLVAQPDSDWWDNQATPAREDRDAILQQALAEAVDELEGLQGANPSGWNWGKLHAVTFQNQSLGKSGVAPIEALFNRGPFPVAGSSSIVNATGWRPANDEPYRLESLPSMRMIVDLSDLSRSQTVNTTGQSGHAYHPHYVDQADLWRNIRFHPMLWTDEQIRVEGSDHLRLVP